MSLPRTYPHPMIDLGSIAGLRAHDHELHAYCQQCDRWVALDLAAMIRDGHGERRLPITVRCRHCGEVGRLQVRPPVPTRVGTIGWVMPVAAHEFPCDTLPASASRHGTEGII